MECKGHKHSLEILDQTKFCAKDDESAKYYYENFYLSYFHKLNVVVYLALH